MTKILLVLSVLSVVACSHIPKTDGHRQPSSEEKSFHVDVVLPKAGQYVVTIDSKLDEGVNPLVCGPTDYVVIAPKKIEETENNKLLLVAEFSEVNFDWRTARGPIATIGYICESNTATGYFNVQHETTVRVKYAKAEDWKNAKVTLKRVK